MDLTQRPRRNRRNESLRDLLSETRLHPADFIFPLFLEDKASARLPISSMPGIYRLGEKEVLQTIEHAMNKGIRAFAPFPNIQESLKDRFAKHSLDENGLYLRSIRTIVREFPEAVLFTDVAMDPYSSDGHDGLVEDGIILNDETVVILADMALAQARAGAHTVAPSDMMDGRIGFIRKHLDAHGFSDTGMLSYAAKYASALYGPFRDALESTPRFGDKKTYQMNPANRKEALREVMLDVEEGADMVMVKPAGMYLDVIAEVSRSVQVPVAAYQVSGEYSMIKAASANGWIDHDKAMVESLLAIKRAGADVILSYFALDLP